MLAVKNNNRLKSTASIKFNLPDILMFLGLTLEFIFQGSIISQAGFIMTLGAGALCLFSKQKAPIKICSFIIFYLLLIGYFFFRIKNGDSIAPLISQAYLQTMLYCVIFMFFTYQYLCQRSLTEITTLLSAVCLALSAYLVLTGAVFAGNRLAGSGINSNDIGSLCSTVISLLCFQLLTKEKKVSGKNIALMLWLLFLVFLSGSRMALFLCIAPSLLFYLFRQRKGIILRAVAILIFGFVVFFLLIKVDLLYNTIGFRVENALSWLMTGETDEGSMNTRSKFLKIGLDYFKQSPWTGYGLFSFSVLPDTNGTYSHNNYIELLVSGGIPALLLFYLPFILLIFKLVKHKNNKMALFLLCFIICTLLMHVASVPFYTRIELFVCLIAFSSLNNIRFEKALY